MVSKQSEESSKIQKQLNACLKQSETRLMKAVELFKRAMIHKTAEETVRCEFQKLAIETTNAEVILKETMKDADSEFHVKQVVTASFKEVVQILLEQANANLEFDSFLKGFLRIAELFFKKTIKEHQKGDECLKMTIMNLVEQNVVDANEWSTFSCQLASVSRDLVAEIEKLELENGTIKDENANLKLEVQNTLLDFEEASRSFENSESEMNLRFEEVNKKYENLLEELNENKGRIETLVHELNYEKTTNASSSVKLENLTSDYEHLQQLMGAAEKDSLANFEDMQNQLRADVESLKEELLVKENEMQLKDDLLNDKENEIGGIKSTCEALRDEIKKLIEEVDTQKFVYEECSAEKSVLESEKRQVDFQNKELESNIENLRSQISALESQNCAQVEENRVLTTEKNRLVLELGQEIALNGDLKQEQEKGRTCMEFLENDRTQLTRQVETVLAQKANVEKDKLTFESLCGELQEITSKLESEKTALEAKVVASETCVVELRAHLETSKENNDVLKSEVDDLRMKIAVSEGDALGAQKVADELRASYTGEIEKLKNVVKEKEDELQLMKHEGQSALEHATEAGETRVKELKAAVEHVYKKASFVSYKV